MTSIFNLLPLMLSQASQAELELLTDSFKDIKKQVWTKDHYFFRQEAFRDQIILIEKGLVRCFYIEEDRDINLRFLCGGSAALPFSSLAAHWIDQNNSLKSNEYIQAVSEVEGYAIPLEYLSDQTKYPEFNLLRVELSNRHYLSVERRLRMIQNIKATERYQKFLLWMPEEIVKNMPNHHVASYLGIAPESLSRLKHRLLRDH